MHTFDALGVTSSSYTCSASGTCIGSTLTTQRTFIALQTAINRLGASYDVARISTDGKIGPATVRAAAALTQAVYRRYGAGIDPILSELFLIELEGQPTTARDLANSAEAVTAAFERGGVKSTLTTIKQFASEIVNGSGGQAASVGPGAAAPINPYPTTVPTAPSPPATSAVSTVPTVVTVTPPIPPVYVPAPMGIPTWGLIAGGVGILAFVTGITAAILHGRRRHAAA